MQPDPQQPAVGTLPCRAEQIYALGQSIWYDNIRRGLLVSGELARMIDREGVMGVTSNPTIFMKAITGSHDYDLSLSHLASQGKRPAEIYDALVLEDIRMAADALAPVYARTHGVDGRVSIEVSPEMAHSTEEQLGEARRLFGLVDRPNVMIKIPATPEGIPAIRTALAEGIPVNVTLIFSEKAYAAVMEAYLSALEERARRGLPLEGVASVASFFVSRVDSAVDKLLEAKAQSATPAEAVRIGALAGKAAVANARMAYQQFLRVFESDRFRVLADKGARVQRPLWASTSTKNPAYPDTMYVDALIGPNTVNTVPAETLVALNDHATVRTTVTQGIDEARRVLADLAMLGIDLQAVLEQLLTDGVTSFSDSFRELNAAIGQKALGVPRA